MAIPKPPSPGRLARLKNYVGNAKIETVSCFLLGFIMIPFFVKSGMSYLENRHFSQMETFMKEPTLYVDLSQPPRGSYSGANVNANLSTSASAPPTEEKK